MSAIQAIKANKDMKTYQKQADAALNQYASITRPNAYAGLKAADVSSLDYQQNQQLMSQGVDTLGGLGAEGAAGVAGLFEAGRQANLQAAQAQGQANYQRDAMVAQEQSDIFAEQAKAQREVAGYRAGAAISGQQQAADARSSAIEGMFGSALSAINYAGQELSPYWNSRNKNRNPAPGTNAGNTTPMTQEQYNASSPNMGQFGYVGIG